MNNINEISEVYLKVFSDPLWNDWEYDELNKYSKNKEGNIVRTLDEQVLKIKTEVYTNGILKKGFISENIFDTKNKVIGICYGWNDSLNNLNNDKFLINEKIFFEVKEKIINLIGYENAIDDIFYHSQIGIIKEFRGNGYGKIMLNNFLEKVGLTNKSMILRTSVKSSYFKLLVKMDRKIIHYFDSERVLVVLPLLNYE